MPKKTKQVKGHWYYVFWGIMTATVFTGQLYVGLGYRTMAEATSLATEKCLNGSSN